MNTETIEIEFTEDELMPLVKRFCHDTLSEPSVEVFKEGILKTDTKTALLQAVINECIVYVLQDVIKGNPPFDEYRDL